MKIGPVDTEMALLIVKKEEITEGKIYSPIGRFAERAKQQLLLLDEMSLATKSKILGDITWMSPLHKYWGDMSPVP